MELAIAALRERLASAKGDADGFEQTAKKAEEWCAACRQSAADRRELANQLQKAITKLERASKGASE